MTTPRRKTPAPESFDWARVLERAKREILNAPIEQPQTAVSPGTDWELYAIVGDTAYWRKKNAP